MLLYQSVTIGVQNTIDSYCYSIPGYWLQGGIMSKTGLAIIIAITAMTILSGCGRKVIPGVLEGGNHVPPPPSEAHRVTSRVSSPTLETLDQASSPSGLKAPIK